eukprot:EG_transcript_37122
MRTMWFRLTDVFVLHTPHLPCVLGAPFPTPSVSAVFWSLMLASFGWTVPRRGFIFCANCGGGNPSAHLGGPRPTAVLSPAYGEAVAWAGQEALEEREAVVAQLGRELEALRDAQGASDAATERRQV